MKKFTTLLLTLALAVGLCACSPKVTVSEEPKTDDMTLEEFGQAAAAEKTVFCNVMEQDGEPVDVLNYYDPDNETYVQSYITENDNTFVIRDYIFETISEPLALSDRTFRLHDGYKGEVVSDSKFKFEKHYTADDDKLPELVVYQRSADGMSLEDEIEKYASKYDLLRGEMIKRNGMDVAFIGYIDDGIFNVRAFIEEGNDHIGIYAYAEAEKFQHVVNAILDSVS